MSAPRITLRPEDLALYHQEAPVALVKLYVALEDWEQFIAMAYQGMEIPVRVEGSDEEPVTAVLHGADERDQSITVVI